jgi:hypothetical protein
MHPTREETMYFEAPLAADFQAVLDRWTHYAHYH